MGGSVCSEYNNEYNNEHNDEHNDEHNNNQNKGTNLFLTICIPFDEIPVTLTLLPL